MEVRSINAINDTIVFMTFVIKVSEIRMQRREEFHKISGKIRRNADSGTN